MEKVLPKGWLETELGRVLTINMGQSPSSLSYNSEGIGVPFMQGKTEFGKIFPTIVKFTTEPTKIVDKNTVLLSVRAPIGPTNMSNVKMCIGRGLAGITSPVISSKFILYYIRSIEGLLDSLGTGTTFKAISSITLNNIPFLIPPLAEQERIVAKLDALFAQHELMQKALERIPQLLKDFRQQVLTHAVTGKLTKQWREGKDSELTIENYGLNSNFRKWMFFKPDVWKVIAFEDAALIKSNLVDPNLYPNYFLIAPDNIETNSGTLISKPLVSEIKPISGKHLFEKGVIIYSKIRPYLNKLIVAEFEGLCSADMYPIHNRAHTDIRYIYFYMLSQEFLHYSTTAGERSVLPKINQKGLNEIPFPIPPLNEQQEIVSRVESLFKKADAIEAIYIKLKEKISSLPQALLHKAFKGELVPQLSTDGDAKDLLAEIMKLKMR